MSGARQWWQEGVIYQLLVPSFLDTSGDGVGDLKGVTSRLEYLQWLGVRAVWLSPIYPSPLSDLGYDVIDFENVEPKFGTLDDFDELIAEAHRRDLKVILDWVPNHTSDEHPWFAESRSSRDNPKRDWYIWRDPKPDGSPPNNWISVFGGNVWRWDELSGQFYLHTFLEKQPDLNWRNPEVRSALLATLRFWLKRGVDGFRVDALDLLLKDEQFRDNPPNPDYHEGQGPDRQVLPEYTRDQPGIHDIVAEMRAVVDEYGDDRILAGELYLPLEKVVAYYGRDRPELQLPLNMELAWMAWNAEGLGKAIQSYSDQVPPHGWPVWTLSTHDCPRLATRCQGEQTRVAAMLLTTLRGTPTHYYGEEIGMKGTPIPSEHAVDPQGRRVGRNRDPARTPMQWSAELHGGFSSVEPWLPITDDFSNANVASQSGDPGSLLGLYRRLFQLRGEEPTLLTGRMEVVSRDSSLLAYRRTSESGALLVVLNFTGEARSFPLESLAGHVVLSTFLDREGERVQHELALRGNEGMVIAIE